MFPIFFNILKVLDNKKNRKELYMDKNRKIKKEETGKKKGKYLDI